MLMQNRLRHRRVVELNSKTTATFLNSKSILLDGSNEYINCGNDTSLDITGALSLSLWFKSSSLVGNDGAFISKSSDAAKYFGSTTFKVYELAILDNIVYFQISSGTTQRTININISSFIDGNWHNIIASWDGTTDTNGMKMYIEDDLKVEGTATGISSIQTLNSVLDIGGYTTSWNFNGNIDEVSLWKTNIVTSELYNSGSPTDLLLHSNENDLVSWWGFDNGVWDGSNWAFADQKGSNDGASVNMEEADLVTDVP